MKITNKNLHNFIGFLVICSVLGTLCWELIEVLIRIAGVNFTLTAGPVGFDIGVLSIHIKINPGTPAGFAAGWLLFKRI
ncbi:MAG: hypothetical protein JEZ04_15330 [Spirochaetales bacterium]|nr:hypothetical protein [Spirochaetales bacterium]